jgi:hypothetical protein
LVGAKEGEMEEIAKYVEILKDAGLNPEQIANVLAETVCLSVDTRTLPRPG